MNLVPEMPLKGGLIIKEDSLRGEVKFNSVSFKYPTRPDQVKYEYFYLLIKEDF